MSEQTKNHLINLLKLVIGIGLLVFLYTKLEDPAGLWRQIRESNKLLLLAAIGTYAAAVALSGIKWGVLLHAIGIEAPTSRLLSYQWMAEFFNNFLPAQVGGDVIRGYALATATHRTADAAASVLIDRFLGLLVFMLSAAVASLSMLLWGRPSGVPFTGDELFSIRIMALGSMAIAFALVMVLVAMLSRRVKRLGDWTLGILPFSTKTMPIWQKLAEAFNAYRYQYRALFVAALSSLIIVFLTSVQIWLITESLQPGSISLLEVLVINPIIVLLLVAVPLSPGGLGVRQGAFSIMYALIGPGGDLGYAVGLMQQFVTYVVSVPGGLLWMRSGQRAQSPDRPGTPPGAEATGLVNDDL